MNKKGFTLIELLGVILILSLLVIIVLPTITNSVNNFSTKTDKLMLKMIKEAAKLYVEDNGNRFVKGNGMDYCLLVDDLINEGYLKDFNNNVSHSIKNINSVKIIYNNGFEYSIATNEECYPLVDYIKEIYSETTTTTVNDIEYSLDETHLLMNDRLGSKNVSKTDGNIRYYGKTPNNYIDIGDRDSDGNIIFWRIIGLFKDVEVADEQGNIIKKEDLVKIIRADKLSDEVDNMIFSWDHKYDGTTSSYSNDWTISTLQLLLNNTYHNSEKTDYYNYYGKDYSTVPTELNFENKGLSRITHNKIERVKWNLGSSNAVEIYTDTMYGYERVGTKSWLGRIALMYPSDYGYSTDMKECKVTLNNYLEASCKDTNWIYDSSTYQWALTPFSRNTHQAFYATSSGNVNYNSQVTTTYGVRPVMYLKSNVNIVEEKETSDGLKYLVVD